MHGLKIYSCALALALGSAAAVPPAMADGLSLVTQAKGGVHGPGGGGGGGGGTGGSACPTGSLCNADGTVTDAWQFSPGGRAQNYQGWMSPDVSAAWSAGNLGQGTSMVFVDDFSSTDTFGPYDWGNTGTTPGGFTGSESTTIQQHGFWTTEEAGMIAPSAAIYADDFSTEDPIYLAPGFNAVNLSYGMFASAILYNTHWYKRGYDQEKSIIDGAKAGNAVYAKAAGNDAVAVGTPTANGTLDFLGTSLIGTPTTIFVGALDKNGTAASPTQLSWYSDYAGSDTKVQSHFLSVGVDYMATGLAGTSFAAPIVTGYAAIIAGKFSGATPTQVTNQLLATARTDTISNYDPAVYGVGEASLANALAPSTIQ